MAFRADTEEKLEAPSCAKSYSDCTDHQDYPCRREAAIRVIRGKIFFPPSLHRGIRFLLKRSVP
jgi:hypothetical protein